MSEFRIKVINKNYRFTHPDKCPICHRLIVDPSSPTNYVYDKTAEVIFKCPNPDCKRLFMGYFKLNETDPSDAFRLIPFEPGPSELPQIINSISPTFIQIYKQAFAAKDTGLDQICGPGFRKAFEFLIKDYAKTKTDDENEKEKIDKKFAGAVVKDSIEDTRIQAVAERALWLGNDEVHYLRKWTDHDVEDLINLIKLTIHWIEIEQLSKKYIKDMPKD